MFKLCLVLVALLGLSAGGAVPQVRNQPGALDAVMENFVKMIDFDEVAQILMRYLFDPDVQTVMQFLFSPEFAALYLEIAELPETKGFILLLEKWGMSANIAIERIRDFFLLPPRQGIQRAARAGIVGLIDEILAVLPIEEMIKLADYHVENTPEFAALYEHMQSPEFAAVMQNLQLHPTVVKMGNGLQALNVDVNHLITIINTNLGWQLQPHPPASLK